MNLVEELAKLHEVQKVDYQIYQREQAIKALDSGEGLKQEAIGLLKQSDAAIATHKQLESEQRKRELELKSIEEKRNAIHERLYSGRVTNPKELGDMQAEEEMFREQINALEEPLLELMDKVEHAETVETTLAGSLTAAKRRWKETVTHTQHETARLQQEIAALRPERERLATLVDKSLLRRYDDIRSRREGIGLVVTGNTNCPACQIKLTSRVTDALRDGEELTLCENCGRILVWLQ